MIANELPLRRVILTTVSLLTLLLSAAGSAIAASLLHSGERVLVYLVLAFPVLLGLVFGIVYVAKTTTLWRAVGFGFFSFVFAGATFALAMRAVSQPLYVVENYSATVVVQDVYAREGQLRIRKEILATRGGFTELLLPSLGAEGEVVDFGVDVLGREFFLEKTRTAGSWHGRIRFPEPVRAGERLTVNAVIGTIDESATALKANENVYGHALIWERVNRLELGIAAPKARPCTTSKAWSIDPLGARAEIALAVSSSQGTSITVVVESPRIDWQYVVECTLRDTTIDL